MCFYCLNCGSREIGPRPHMDVKQVAQHFGVSRYFVATRIVRGPANPDGVPYVQVGNRKVMRTDRVYQLWEELERASTDKYTLDLAVCQP